LLPFVMGVADRVYRIAVHPAGTMFASGGEDGFVRLHHFDESYFRAKPYGDMHVED
jgi:translation initiation factor 3 subunit I